VLQVVVLGVLPFVLYRFLLDTIGVELLGVWSVVLSTSTISRIGELGLSASAVKFVAKYVAREDMETAADALQTAVLTVAAVLGLGLLLAYPVARWILGMVIPSEQLGAALSILPYALLSLFLAAVTGVYQSGLEGCQRIDLRGAILMGGAVLHLLLCFLLTPTYSLMGLAYARAIQTVVALFVTWWLTRITMKKIPLVPYRWSRRLFKEMVGYGVNFHVATLMRMIYEPTTTALLSKFGGLSTVAYYEMANRMVRQVRGLLVTANQVLVPFIADLSERRPEAVRSVYEDSYELSLYIALPLYSFVIALSPLVSEVWIGYYESSFVRFAMMLSVGWFFNTVTSPAYFANLGIGELRWNTASSIIMVASNALLGITLGSLYGGDAVVVAWVFSLAASSFLIPLAYHRKHQVSLKSLFPSESKGIAVACAIALAVTLVLYYAWLASLGLLPAIAISTACFASIAGIPLWLHPMRRRLTGWFSRYLLRPSQAVLH
jgi:O-antigen/teichoic acid export membrane protein